MFQSAIQRILPHRYPFLLVDRVAEFVPEQRIAGIKNFGAEDEILRGYFPGSDLVPASALIEMVTQLGAILVLERPGLEGKIAVILQIPMARMLEQVRSGDCLRVEAEVTRMRETFGELRGAVYRGSDLVAEGQMRFAIANAADLLLQNQPKGHG